MKSPLLLLRAPDDWLATQLRDWAADRKWVVRAVSQWGAFAAAVAPRRPCVAFLQAELAADAWAVALADLHHRHPDAAVVVVSDTKLSDDARAVVTAAAADLGARHVLFPPITRQGLEDVASGLAEVVLARATATPKTEAEPVLDLREGDFETP